MKRVVRPDFSRDIYPVVIVAALLQLVGSFWTVGYQLLMAAGGALIALP